MNVVLYLDFHTQNAIKNKQFSVGFSLILLLIDRQNLTIKYLYQHSKELSNK